MSKNTKTKQVVKVAPATKAVAATNSDEAQKNSATTAVGAADVKDGQEKAKEPLTKEQVKSLLKHEGVIEQHLNDFREIGQALKAILDEKLYLSEFDDFDVYCPERWDFSGSHARRLIVAAECMGVLEKEISPIGEKMVLPRNEAQVRALTDVEENSKKWAKAWLKVLKATECKGITGEKIKEVLAKTGGTNSTGKAKSSKATAKPVTDAAVKKLTRIEKVVDGVLDEKDPTVEELKKALTQIREVLKTKKA